MSLLNKATIITTPTAHSNGTLHSIKGGEVADFDVVRGSAATRVNAEGLIESVAANIPRIDYTTGEGVVLLEPQSTNLCFDSNVFDDVSGGTTSNNELSPDGTTNATNIFFSTGSNSGAKIRVGGSSATPSTDYTISFYAKNFSGDGTFRLRLDTDTQPTLVNESFTATSEWARYTHTFTTDAAASSFGASSRFRKSTTTDNNEVLFYGVQLEVGSLATSYIPTSGAIATRLADSLTGAGDVNTFNDSEGVLYFEGSSLSNSLNTDGLIRIGSSSDAVDFRFDTTQNRVQIVVRAGGVNQTTSGRVITDTTANNKFALKYKENDIALWVNGVEEITVSSAITPTGLDTLSIVSFAGKLKVLAVFNEALTDSELECLTKI